jgi:hypothetical protein
MLLFAPVPADPNHLNLMLLSGHRLALGKRETA